MILPLRNRKKCKKCLQFCMEDNWCSTCGFQNDGYMKNQIVFKMSDYDLSMKLRKLKYKDYDIIFCGKCKQKFDINLFYCKPCYDYETKEEKRNHMKYGKRIECLQACTENNWCPYCEIQNNERQNIIFFKISDYDLDLMERRAKFNDYDLILCGKCNQKIDNTLVKCNSCNIDKKGCTIHLVYSSQCLPCRFRQESYKWTSDNENIDKLIQESQIFALDLFSFLEWIPFYRFTNIRFIAEGGFSKVYSATWTDGYIVDWKDPNNWERYGSLRVALKVLNNSSENISKDFLNEVIIKQLCELI
jgi:hypothetical protein